jgi:ribosomal protein L37AE/L43A
MLPMPEQVFCPVCGKMGWNDERRPVGIHWPCVSCTEEFILMEGGNHV